MLQEAVDAGNEAWDAVNKFMGNFWKLLQQHGCYLTSELHLITYPRASNKPVIIFYGLGGHTRMPLTDQDVFTMFISQTLRKS